jgi:hypothetical protein
VRIESKKAWLACAIDSEGTVQVARQNSVNMHTSAYGLRVIIYNSDAAYISQVCDFLTAIGVEANYNPTRRTSKIGTKLVTEIRVQTLDSVITLLKAVIPFLTAKKAIATAVLGLALMRKQSRAKGERAPWTVEELEQAEYIRKTFMLYSRANGETLPASELRAIPSEASGSEICTEEPLETRSTSIASSKSTHECPAPQEGDDIVRTPAKVGKLR